MKNPSFRITGLPPDLFRSLFAASDLANNGRKKSGGRPVMRNDGIVMRNLVVVSEPHCDN